jgi:hypothetical protein
LILGFVLLIKFGRTFIDGGDKARLSGKTFAGRNCPLTPPIGAVQLFRRPSLLEMSGPRAPTDFVRMKQADANTLV